MFERFFKKQKKPALEKKVEPIQVEKERRIPEDESALSRLCESVGWVPEELLALYRNPEDRDLHSTVRLMSIEEVLQTNADLVSAGYIQAGPVSWHWTDDNSNYSGIYTEGPLKGWLTRLNHDEPTLIPAYRSVTSFLAYLAGSQDACGIPSLGFEMPLVEVDAAHTESDRQLAAYFRDRYQEEQGDDLKRHFAFCSICLTPPEHTPDVLVFFGDKDMWTPEAAVRLLELRRFEGDSAAMRQLARLGTGAANDAIARLKQSLEGQKRQSLEMWQRVRLQPPRWP
jgi:hypothetical protein